MNAPLEQFANTFVTLFPDWRYDDQSSVDIVLDCYSERDCALGLKYFGVEIDTTQHIISWPDDLDFDTSVVDRLEQDIDHPETNPYYVWMKEQNKWALSGDDAYFDYGNSWVTAFIEALEEMVKNVLN